jgi:hypothetical protein
MSLEEEHKQWRSLLQVEQLKLLTFAERALLAATGAYNKNPCDATEKAVEHAREHLEAQKQLAHEVSQELEALIQSAGDRP